jgi:hypothetical protein
MPPNVLDSCYRKDASAKEKKAVCLTEEGAKWIKDLLIYQKKLEAAPCFE